MSAYDNLQMFYKRAPTPKGEIKDPWALGHYLAETYGNHTQAEYAKALEDKQYSKDWNPLTAAAKEKKAKSDANKKEAKDDAAKEKRRESGRKGGAATARKRAAGTGGRQARMKLSLDESLALLNLLKGDKIKEDKKDEHEDKEPIKDPFAVATWRTEREGHDLSTDEGKERRKEIVDDIKEEGNVVEDKDEEVKKSAPLQKISPGLAGLMAAAAGWAMSDEIVRSGGGSPRGEMTPQQLRQWERTVRRSMRKKDTSLDKSSWEKLQKNYYDDSDLYFRKVPVQNAVAISKDHAPVPPRQGLQWDELKKKWVSSDHLGRSATELQGKKRIRGSGTGVHEHALHVGGAGGKGVGSGVAGRRFRSVGDSGVQSPHESKHVAGYKRRTSGGGHLPSSARTSSARRAMSNKARSRARAASTVTSKTHYGPSRMAAQMKPMPESKGPKIKQ
tara:strand:+ start:556 stop:1893 length:1338 start_codon:yes stop_codon:yes gene_type:complete